MDKTANYKLLQQRKEEPDVCPSPVCDWYAAKLEHLALLEFDRDRKSMSVICRQTPYTRHSGKLALLDALHTWLLVWPTVAVHLLCDDICFLVSNRLSCLNLTPFLLDL